MTVQNSLIDNCNSLKLVDTIKTLILQPEITDVAIATGYLDIKGLHLIHKEIRSLLERSETHFRLLIGKDPLIFTRLMYGKKDESAKKDEYPLTFIKKDIAKLDAKGEYFPSIELLLDFCTNDENSKIDIRIFKDEENPLQFFHSKCYVFYGKSQAYGIIGSSNFTGKGLEENSELNYLETNPMIVKFASEDSSSLKGHKAWFEEKWKLSESWNIKFLEEVIKTSPIGKACLAYKRKKENLCLEPMLPSNEITPYECYVKLLQDRFSIIMDDNFKSKLKSYLPPSIKPYEYQINAVQQCYLSLAQHGGFVLGDVVGLGKTIVALLIVKYFIEKKKQNKVLIITPPSIRFAWEATVDRFDEGQDDKIKRHITFLSIGKVSSLSKVDGASNFEKDSFYSLKQKKESYGLVIIDESHRFRNAKTQMYKGLKEYLEKTQVYPLIGLISATMQNNRPQDIQSQIYLFERQPICSSFERVEGKNLDAFFRRINREYKRIIKRNRWESIGDFIKDDFKKEDIKEDVKTDIEEDAQELLSLSKEVREKVLHDVLIRRTRRDIKQYYSKEFTFPTVHAPKNLYYEMQGKVAELFYETIEVLLASVAKHVFYKKNYSHSKKQALNRKKIGYFRYKAIVFLNKEYRKLYSKKNATAEHTATNLARIMATLLVKRLESSFDAFKTSINNLRRYTQNMIDMWEHNSIFICPDIDVNKELNIEKKEAKNERKITFEDCLNDIRKRIEKLNKNGKNKDGRNREYKRSDFREIDDKSYVEYLKEDLAKIDELIERWKCVKEKDDGKLQKFIEALLLPQLFFSKDKNESQKLVIFSESVVTGRLLKRVIIEKTDKRVLVITSGNRKKMEEVISANFDATYPKEKQRDDFDVVIATDVLAEGINLHRSNTILNYDVPWNATKLIQRIGRINRLDGQYLHLYVYNFYPSNQGDREINLVQKAYTKLQTFHAMFGGDAKIFSENEQLTESKFDEMITGEASEAEKYLNVLKAFKKAEPERYLFLESLNVCEEKTIKKNEMTGILACFAIKTGNRTVYERIEYDEDGKFEVFDISYSEMFELCSCAKDDEALPIVPSNADALRKMVLEAYKKHVNKNTKRIKNKNEESLKVAKIAHEFLACDVCPLDSNIRSLLSRAIASIKNGNTGLAKRLSYIISTIKDKNMNCEDSETFDVATFITENLADYNKNLLNDDNSFTDETNQKLKNKETYKEPYIMAAFYFI